MFRKKKRQFLFSLFGANNNQHMDFKTIKTNTHQKESRKSNMSKQEKKTHKATEQQKKKNA